MSELANTMGLYRDIFSYEDFVPPFVEFCREVRSQEPLPEAMIAASVQNGRLLGAVREVRRARTYTRGHDNGEYFRGSGCLVAGDREGLRAVDYRPGVPYPGHEPGDGEDPVATQYGNYPHVALEKAGRAALALRLASAGRTRRSTYRAVNDVFLEHDLLENPSIPHTLGYAYDRSGLVIGASGMLPSRTTANGMRIYRGLLDRDYARGWVSRPLDEFAGYYDQVAAGLVYGTGPSMYRELLTASVAADVNLH